MQVVETIKSIRQLIQKAKAKNKKIGFVPTMGALHEGHLSLIHKCKKENNLTVLSIFVNPSQFSPTEDLAKYPRMFKQDLLLAKKENVDIIFHPSAEEMYPEGSCEGLTYVEVEKPGSILCGKFRPKHFRGVATVVTKLLNIIEPHAFYLGQKDAQQAVILKKIIEDLNFPVIVNICPTVRERNGLALSSRNVFLTRGQKEEAVVLFQSLQEAEKRIFKGERHPGKITEWIKENIKENSSGKVQYVECVSADSLGALKRLEGEVLIALAVFFGRTRLIDNIIVKL